ncbi:MAG: radical SAM protein [Myxococcota bacterium]
MNEPLSLRDHVMVGLTQSLCPECVNEGRMELVRAKILVRNGRVYFRKRCPIHGTRDDFVCSDADWYDQLELSVPGKIPATFGVEPKDGCPRDCGLCTDHEQHTCIGLVELTGDCNLRCPMCYAGSGPGGKHESKEAVLRAIDRLVEVEGGHAEVLQLSGGEPTIHPDFVEIFEYAVAQPIDLIMLNTNGLLLERDEGLLAALAKHNRRVEVYLQLDGLDEESSQALRGASLVDRKLRAIDRLGEIDVRVTLVCTLQSNLNLDQVGPLVELAVSKKHVAGVSFQPATYSGRNVTPEELESRVTYPDVVRAICTQTEWFRGDDFMPLPCAHPNCHTLTYAFREEGKLTPLMRFIDGREHKEVLANGIAYTRARGREVVEEYLRAFGCDAAGCDGLETIRGAIQDAAKRSEHPEEALSFFTKALTEKLSPENVFRITITSFLDAYNFDVRRLMKCCIHHVLPSGHVVPFCAYNVLYRPGILPLPELEGVVPLRTAK